MQMVAVISFSSVIVYSVYQQTTADCWGTFPSGLDLKSHINCHLCGIFAAGDAWKSFF